MNQTEKYIKQYEDAFNLKKTKYKEGIKKKFTLDSVFALAKIRVITLILSVSQYIVHLWKYRKYIGNIFKQKGSGSGKDVLIIGNGPSQGLLNLEFLNSFSKSGNDTMAVNFWPSNKSLSEHVPTFMVFSDPASLKKDTFDKPGVDMEISAVKQKELIEYLSKNTINIVAPINHLKDLKGMKELKRSRFYGFVDIEFRGWNNIHPAFPRGYTSMTMYKMLAWAIYKEYDNVYIIGMDNTYIRSLYNDHNNQLWNVEEHADGENYLHKLDAYDSMASRLQDLIYLFSDLRKFKKDNIYNIDPYSLVDQFEKKDLVAEFKFKSNKR